MTRALTGKVALVTGAAKGIGAGIAKAMASAGASVVVNFASDRAGAERVVADIKAAGGTRSRFKRMSPLSPRWSIWLPKRPRRSGPLDILVNNASVFAFASLEQITHEQLHKMLDTNLWGTIVTCREALKHFSNDGGSIINIGLMSSERFSAGAAAYTASKAGITGVTGVLAVELASRGIRVNQVNPGAVDTEGARAIGAMSVEAWAAHIARTPLGRVGTPADIASVAVFLASDEAGWLTGECLAVSGGLR